jgi:peptidoglycan hydrolase-like protein with peptidoglycan-binding domain
MFKKIIVITTLILLISACAFADVAPANVTLETLGKEVLKHGMDQDAVGFVKLSMMILGYYDTKALTNTYDDELLLAIKAYQKDRQLETDGIIGEQSFGALVVDEAIPVIHSSVLKLEQQGADIKVLKVALRSLNYLMTPVTDDVFDNATFEALKAFQKAQSLEVDGVAGLATIDKLVALKRAFFIPAEVPLEVMTATKLEKGMVSAEVIVLQKALAREGVFTAKEFSTHFGDLTLAAVKTFQTKYGLIADGVAGEGTLQKLVDLGYFKKGIPVEKAVVVSRSSTRDGFGEYIAWADASALLKRMTTIVTVEDFETGKTFKIKVSYGHNHADVEALTAEDAKMIKAIWGGQWTWERRAVLVYYKDRVLAASMNAMPHAGLDKQPEGSTVSGRSGGFGKGYNYDSIKGNGMDGHFCLHFKGSKLHTGGKTDSKHQEMVKKAAGIK